MSSSSSSGYGIFGSSSSSGYGIFGSSSSSSNEMVVSSSELNIKPHFAPSSFQNVVQAKLSKGQLWNGCPDYELPWDALAEIVDNSSDAHLKATALDVHRGERNYRARVKIDLFDNKLICVSDNILGMSSDDHIQAITVLGNDNHRSDEQDVDASSAFVGLYGEGLRTSCVYLGNIALYVSVCARTKERSVILMVHPMHAFWRIGDSDGKTMHFYVARASADGQFLDGGDSEMAQRIEKFWQDQNIPVPRPDETSQNASESFWDSIFDEFLTTSGGFRVLVADLHCADIRCDRRPGTTKEPKHPEFDMRDPETDEFDICLTLQALKNLDETKGWSLKAGKRYNQKLPCNYYISARCYFEDYRCKMDNMPELLLRGKRVDIGRAVLSRDVGALSTLDPVDLFGFNQQNERLIEQVRNNVTVSIDFKWVRGDFHERTKTLPWGLNVRYGVSSCFFPSVRFANTFDIQIMFQGRTIMRNWATGTQRGAAGRQKVKRFQHAEVQWEHRGRGVRGVLDIRCRGRIPELIMPKTTKVGFRQGERLMPRLTEKIQQLVEKFTIDRRFRPVDFGKNLPEGAAPKKARAAPKRAPAAAEKTRTAPKRKRAAPVPIPAPYDSDSSDEREQIRSTRSSRRRAVVDRCKDTRAEPPPPAAKKRRASARVKKPGRRSTSTAVVAVEQKEDVDDRKWVCGHCDSELGTVLADNECIVTARAFLGDDFVCVHGSNHRRNDRRRIVTKWSALIRKLDACRMLAESVIAAHT